MRSPRRPARTGSARTRSAATPSPGSWPAGGRCSSSPRRLRCSRPTPRDDARARLRLPARDRGRRPVALFEAVLVLPVVIFASVTIAAARPVAGGRRRRGRDADDPHRRANGPRGGAVRTGSRIRRRRARPHRDAAHIMLREILPNIRRGGRRRVHAPHHAAVVAVATLSFIGLGSRAAHPGLGAADRRALLAAGRRRRVGGPVPGARDRLARRRPLADPRGRDGGRGPLVVARRVRPDGERAGPRLALRDVLVGVVARPYERPGGECSKPRA